MHFKFRDEAGWAKAVILSHQSTRAERIAAMTFASRVEQQGVQVGQALFPEFVQPSVSAAPARATVFGMLVRFADSLLHLAIVKLRERTTINELQALDDRILNDIGVNRSEIPELARMVAEDSLVAGRSH